MKKIVFCLMATCLSLTFFTLQSVAQSKTTPEASTVAVVNSPEQVKPIEAKTIQLKDEGTTTKNNAKLNSSDKKNLQQIERNSDRYYHNGGGVYISVGGAILIIFLLIVLL